MNGTYLRGGTTDPADIVGWLDSEAHDVLFSMGNYSWQDIALPGMNLLHILQQDEEGEVFPYDGVSRYSKDGRMHITYTLGGFLVGFDVDNPVDVPCVLHGSVCTNNAVTPLDAERIIRAIDLEWNSEPEGFIHFNDDIGNSEDYGHYRMDLPCGVSVCVDDSMAWVETIGCSPYLETFDIVKVTTSRDTSDCSVSDGVCLWIYTDRCIIGLPIGEVA